MFGFMKLSGAPPKAYHYYRATKETVEKAILEDLYNKYDALIKAEEFRYKESVKELKSLGMGAYDPEEERKFILSNTFSKLCDYGLNKGYSDLLISLFYQGYR
ncbi:hypothetical protein [Acetoanaerobium sticklandii]|uniref:hypothetical protein n=1 Tax=Acetoanaerobium sticklandii TaxID=1511 RepID=UPI003A937F0F